MSEPHCDVAIVGAGAAGLAAAIFAARAAPGRRIVALDGARRIGAKILVSGGGRCNVTNVRVEAADFNGGSRNAIRRVLKAFDEKQAAAFFEEIGVSLHEEEFGKLFPNSNSAKTVVEALLREAASRGVEVRCGQRVERLTRQADAFELAGPAGVLRARRVVLATGGLSLPKTGSDGGGYALARGLGHSLVSTTPALDPLLLGGDFHQALSGIAHPAELTLTVAGEKPKRITGPLLWTHFGVSGPAALDASRHWHRARLESKAIDVRLSFLPGDDFAAAETRLLNLANAQPRVHLHNALAKLLPARVADALRAALDLSPSVPLAHLSREARRKLVHGLLGWPLSVTGTRGYAYAEVTAGGVPLEEVDLATMESRCCPGLHLVGEILDVDGRLGGFNFQWAWSSGYVAGQGLAAAR